ncbi:MAG TPA: adenylyltransferase/cytidyltransferase family protein, partial [Bacteroidota bacterium]
MGTIISRQELTTLRKRLRTEGKKVVFSNGVFDLLHRGHVEYLNKAKSLGDVLIVGVNSDESVRRIKDDNRPVVSQDDRAFLVSNIASV